MNLKLSSAKRVETEVHHLSAYHLPCSCTAVRDRMLEDDSQKSMTLISRLVILKK